MKKNVFLYLTLLFVFLTACNTTRTIPEGKYLLDKVRINHNTRASTSDLEEFLQQQPNDGLPLLGKIRLKLYNLAGKDSSKLKFKLFRKIGTPPVIFNPRLAKISAAQLQKELQNLGYLRAEVDTSLIYDGKKVTVCYTAKHTIPYRIRNYTNQIQDSLMLKALKTLKRKTHIHKDDYLDFNVLEEERDLVNQTLRNKGYYNFSKNFVYFKADTTLNNHQADLYLNVRPNKDSLPYTKYKFNKITVIAGINPDEFPVGEIQQKYIQYFFTHADTTEYKGITILRGKSKFLRDRTIFRNNYLHPNKFFSDRAMTKTYEAYNKMNATKQVNISLHPAPEDSLHKLNAYVVLFPSDPHSFRAGFEGTNSAGDIGLSPSISYQQQNIFNGSERFYVKLKGAYEFIVGSNNKSNNLLNHSYYEIGGETGLSFPLFLFPWLKQRWRETSTATTDFTAGLTTQHRPEYTREFFNLGISYRWNTHRNKYRHALSLVDLNYVHMPWVSDDFKKLYLSGSNPMLEASYKDQLVERTSYSITFNSQKKNSSSHPTTTQRISGEISGLIPRAIVSAFNVKPSSDGTRQIAGVAYAEYAKASYDFAKTYHFSPKRSLAYHFAAGIAIPYGNSSVLPFERRFFGGGPNSIRGWNTRSLGPGSYKATGNVSNFVNQTGDMTLEANVETRHKIGKYFELAGFFDAGNIWTLRDYPSQPGGQFKLSTFYKEIAMAYGIGFRLDLGFLLLRLDTGVRAYDPGEDIGHRFVLFRPRFSRMAWHFGIGYPF